MGSTTSNCSTLTEAKQSIISREMRIYKWRAQNTANFIPAVEFKCPSLVKQQQKWNEFVEQYKDKDYLQLSQFKKEIEELDSSQEPIISFEKYACSLNELNHLLTPSEAIYTVIALLTAFEQIKKIYVHSVSIERRCCFVTLKGDVRGWVNSNPKSNQIQQNSEYKFYGERQNKEMIKQIIKIVQLMSLNDLRTDSLFLTLNNFIDNAVCQKDIYERTRHFIKGYCRTANIQVSRNLSSALRRSKDITILKFSRKSLLNKAESLQRRNKSIEQSDNYTSAIQQHIRSKRTSNQHEHSFAKNSVPQSTLASVACFNKSLIQQEPYFGAPLHFRRDSLPFRLSEIEAPKSARTEDQRKLFKASQILPNTPKPRVSGEADWSYQKKKEASISQNISQTSSSRQQKMPGMKEEEATLLEGKFLTSRELTTFNLPKARRDHKYKTSNLESKVLRQVSILDIGDQNAGNRENQFKKVHFRTSQDVKSSDTSIEPPPRPWITSKTISQLISDKDDADSLVHSRGTSSEDCAPSSYSGALSTMGRDVSMVKKKGHCQAQAH